ncbi:MAG TPA: universal stress protein [Solirubrobacter sp.]|nr:universal stress protein [Solirubrobacter sp.]
MFQRIMLAWDGSAVSRRAFDIAIDLSRRYESDLVAVSVAYSPAHAETGADRLESADAARRYLQTTFDAVRDRAERVGVPLEHRVVDGDDPSQALLDFSHEHGFDLIVAGHHHGARAGRLLLRGVPEKLVARSGVPVMIVGERDT